MSDGDFQSTKDYHYNNGIHMEASDESIENYVQDSSKFKQGEKVCLKKEVNGYKIRNNFIKKTLTIKQVRFNKTFGIPEYSSIEAPGVYMLENYLELAPIHNRKKLKF